ncbi:hypothetical protein P4H94_07320 [Paenibacillus macerans]|uniref:SLAC1 family transporter n=1 Tax=Paenibacillus macerans TaxID=44252 RepID=UPI002DB56621|nr:hypothetical protein [Paenibacillus macerans]MEC0136694.1 hypothetical protein [Paenibacillus macerans]
MLRVMDEKIKHLFPGYFSMAMATGALSIAVHLLGAPFVSGLLLHLNTCIYVMLWVLTLIRLIKYFSPGQQRSDQPQSRAGLFYLHGGHLRVRQSMGDRGA